MRLRVSLRAAALAALISATAAAYAQTDIAKTVHNLTPEGPGTGSGHRTRSPGATSRLEAETGPRACRSLAHASLMEGVDEISKVCHHHRPPMSTGLRRYKETCTRCRYPAGCRREPLNRAGWPRIGSTEGSSREVGPPLRPAGQV